MSHSTVMVVVHADNVTEAKEQAELALAPFDEGREMEPYFREVNDNEVKSAVDYFTENDDENVGPLPITDDADVMREWSARAVGGYFCGDPDAGVYKDGKYGYMSTYNPDSKWDWYLLGGRWRGYFQAKEGVNVSYPSPHTRLFPVRDNALGVVSDDGDNVSAVLGSPGSFGDAVGESMEGRADLILKGDIDFDAMRSLEGMNAETEYDKFESVTDGLTIPPTWGEVISKYEHMENAIEKAREEFNSYPWVQALRKNGLDPFMSNIHDYWCVNSGGREAFIERARNNAFATYAVLMDGQWHEKGEMGWFGMSSNEMSDEEWAEKVNDLIGGLDDDVWLAVYDVHI